jgi:hypothetical protein
MSRLLSRMAIARGPSVLLSDLKASLSRSPLEKSRERPNQSLGPTAPLGYNFSVLATTPCRGLSLSRWAYTRSERSR